jgi:biopolymer transport protein ExbB/TolQ/DNA-directed RNA polymerase subunit RPC12/RpoP
MYFKTQCPGCGKGLKVGEEQAGKKARCPYCHHAFVIPSPSTEPAEQPAGKGKAAAPHKKKAPADKPAPTNAKRDDGTNVNMVHSFLFGVGFSVVFYLLMLAFSKYYLGELFLGRGWVPFVLVLLMGWSFGILFFKSRKLRTQKDAMLLDMLPTEYSEEITTNTLGKFIKHVHFTPAGLQQTFLVRRVRRGLEHFQARNSNPEVANILSSQSDIDASAVESSYTIVKVFIWAIPILGFIGTVMGISHAVGGFSESMDKAQDIEVLKNSLNEVTSGLALAFDTTLIALVMSLLVSFPASSMQKAEEDVLNSVDEYCNENLIKRLVDSAGYLGAAGSDAELLKRFHAAQDQLAGVQKKQLEQFEEVSQLVGVQAKSLEERANQYQGEVEKNLQQVVEHVQQAMATMAEQQGQIIGEQAEISERREEEYQGRLEQNLNQMVEPMQQFGSYFQGLATGLSSLNEVLGQLGQQQVVIEMKTPPRRRWFFGRKKS